MRRRYNVTVYQIWEVDVETDNPQLLEDRVVDVFINTDLWLTDHFGQGITKDDPKFRETYGFDVLGAQMVDERVESGDGFGLYGVEITKEREPWP